MQTQEERLVVWVAMPPADHVTYVHEAADGTLRAYDITAAKALLYEGRPQFLFSLEAHEVTLAKIRELYEELNETYALTTDLTKPLLFVPLGEETLLIDGWHRLARAAMSGISELPMYLLSQEEADTIQWLHLPPGHNVPWK